MAKFFLNLRFILFKIIDDSSDEGSEDESDSEWQQRGHSEPTLLFLTKLF